MRIHRKKQDERKCYFLQYNQQHQKRSQVAEEKYDKVNDELNNSLEFTRYCFETWKNDEEIETYFKISEVKSYEITVVEEKGESTEGFMDTALSTLTIIGIVIKLLAL